MDRQNARVTIRIVVVEGPQFRVGGVDITGNNILPIEEIRRRVQLKPNDIYSRAKLRDSAYQPGVRSSAWLKIKAVLQQEVVINGFTEPRGSRKYFGALLVGVYEEGKLVYTGHVGGGFDEKTLAELQKFSPRDAQQFRA